MQSSNKDAARDSIDAASAHVDEALDALHGTNERVTTYDGFVQALNRAFYGTSEPPDPVFYRDGLPLDKWRWYYSVDWTWVLCTALACACLITIAALVLAYGGR